jgi:hypothetical protein
MGYPSILEASMHGSFDNSGKNNSIYERWGIGFLALSGLLVITLIGLAMMQPAASNWVSEAVQAEFAHFNVTPEVVPTQFARPAMEMRTVRPD